MQKLLWGAMALLLCGCGKPTVWNYSLTPKNGNAVLDLTGVTFIFSGETLEISEMEDGNATIAESALPSLIGARMPIGSLRDSFQSTYTNKMQIMRFRTNLITIRNAGRDVIINGQASSLKGPKKTFIVPRTGTIAMRNFVPSDAPRYGPLGPELEPMRLDPVKMTNNSAK